MHWKPFWASCWLSWRNDPQGVAAPGCQRQPAWDSTRSLWLRSTQGLGDTWVVMLDLDLIRDRVAAHTPLVLDLQDALDHAAVALIVRPAVDGSEVLLIKRHESPTDRWSGQMAFPGGRRDANDASIEETARRETLEEVGLDLRRGAKLLGRLDDLQAIARGRALSMVITPFVYRFDGHQKPRALSEVERVVWAPLSQMASGHLDATFSWRRGDVEIPFPAFRYQQDTIWGLTYQMLTGFIRLCRL